MWEEKNICCTQTFHRIRVILEEDGVQKNFENLRNVGQNIINIQGIALNEWKLTKLLYKTLKIYEMLDKI